METFYEQTIIKRAARPLQQVSSLGFTMPFQPSMWDDNSIQSALDYTMNIIETKLKKNCTNDCTESMLARLRQLFSQLNFNTHRKSIAVLIYPDSEKIMYLNFPIKLFVSTGKSISILDLIANVKEDISFYLLFICKGNTRLFEYYKRKLNIVYELYADDESGYPVDTALRTSSVITSMNSNHHNPVFIVGSKEDVISFRSTFSYPEIIFQVTNNPLHCNAEITQSIVAEIVDQWSHWSAKFDVARIAMARKANKLVQNYGAVLQALCNSTDGLILMDKRIKKELQKPPKDDIHFHDPKFFISQIEKFVERGNCIGIKENGLLRDWGGIVMLPYTMSGYQNTGSFGGYRLYPKSGNLF